MNVLALNTLGTVVLALDQPFELVQLLLNDSDQRQFPVVRHRCLLPHVQLLDYARRLFLVPILGSQKFEVMEGGVVIEGA